MKAMKLLCGVLSLLIIVGLAIPISSTVVKAAPATEIRDWHDLHAIRDNLGGDYVLMNDLDASTAGYAERASPTADGGKGWQPIGTAANRFTGTFDGQGYEIRDLFIDRSGATNVGLFGFVGVGGVTQNVGVVNAEVTGSPYVGGLVAANLGTVTSSYFAGSVNAGWGYGVGGLVGANAAAGQVRYSYSTCSVTGYGEIGGLVGYNMGLVTGSYSTGSVTGTYFVGGLVGKNDGTVSSSFWDTVTSGMAVSAGGTGKTSTEMQDIATFLGVGWDISAIARGEPHEAYTWNIIQNQSYPFLSWAHRTRVVTTATGSGAAFFTPSHGKIANLAEESVPAHGPTGFTFPHGMFSFEVTGLTSGQTVTITIELPGNMPVSTKWWKYHTGTWYSLAIGSDNGDNIITITLTDGVFPGDADSIAGQITDPGGPGSPGSVVGWETYPVNKAHVVLPWIALLAGITAGASLLVLSRRRAHS